MASDCEETTPAGSMLIMIRSEPRRTTAEFAEWLSSENNRRARYYRLTASGRKQLALEMAWWQRAIGGVDRVLRAATQES